MDLFGFVPGYRGMIFHEGKEPLFLSLLAFVIAFTCTRGYTRLARKYGWGSGSVGGVHLHHDVVGIVFVLVAGLVALTPAGTNPRVRDVCVKRAEQRMRGGFATRFQKRLLDLVGGKPSPTPQDHAS